MRIKCEQCVNEKNSRCSILKTTVKRTKARKCNFYELDQKKEITRLELKAIALDNQEAAFIAKRKKMEAQTIKVDADRFKSTATV